MRVLIVDDDPSVRQVLDVLLGVAGHDIVESVADGRSAIAAAETHRPDAVVLDASLPDMQGITVLRQLREAQPQLRIIIHSGHDDPGMAAAMTQAGADEFVLKGGDPQQLMDALG